MTVDSDIEAPCGHAHRWGALLSLCLGVLMIVLDSTVVNVALPSIKDDLRFSDLSLVWVVNAYMLFYGGFLMLSGRLGDAFCQRKLFLWGIALFTLASLCCGVASSKSLLLTARALQGLGGSLATAVALALMMRLFTEPSERAKAMGIYGFVCGGGGAVGLLLGGVVTSALGWRWIFFINIPVGLVVYALSHAFLPRSGKPVLNGGFDVAGAVIFTTASTLAVYTVVTGNESGWWPWRTVTLTTIVTLLLLILALVETRVRAPLVPRRILSRSLVVANIVGALWSAAEFAWFFISALYLQRVQGYSPQQVGLLFLPANLVTAVLSLGISAKLVMRFGISKPLCAGLLIVSAGLALFTQAPQSQGAAMVVIPGMVLIGLGAGLALNPLLLAAVSGVAPSESGLASGIVNTAIMMGGALGLAVIVNLAAGRASRLQAAGASLISSLNGAYHFAFLAGSMFAAAAALIAAVLLRADVWRNLAPDFVDPRIREAIDSHLEGPLRTAPQPVTLRASRAHPRPAT